MAKKKKQAKPIDLEAKSESFLSELGIDLTKPFIVENVTLDPNDCFGLQYQSKHLECIGCHAQAACLTLYYKSPIQEAIAKLRQERGKYLDEAKFKSYNWGKLAKKLKKKNGEVTTSKLKKQLIKKLDCDQERLVELKILAFMKSYDFIEVDGEIYYNG